MDQLQTRLEALEQQMHTVSGRLRWWRGLACGLVVLSLSSLTFLSGKAADAQSGASANRLVDLHDKLEALESLLQHIEVVTTPEGLQEVVITRANLRIVNGLGSTDCTDDNSGQPILDCPNGLGNLIVGYNERRDIGENIRAGSHNIVVGEQHNFSRFGGLVVGIGNTISGGAGHTAAGTWSSVSGGLFNVARGGSSSVSGGFGNVAGGGTSSVSGGRDNDAIGESSSVSGGQNRTAEGEFDWVAGSLVEDE